MTQYALVVAPLVTRSPVFGAPQMAVVWVQNPLVTEFQRAVVSQLGKALIQVRQALLLAALYWLVQRFTNH